MSWVEEIQSVFAERCAGCHGAEAPDGNYDTSGYLDVLGTGTDTVANAIAGDASSLLLGVLDPATATALHAGLLSDVELDQLTTWVVECRLSYFRSGIHEGGILNPDDSDFHGSLVRSEAWNFDLCAGCHGEDFTGGKANVACTRCHTEGPTACNVCHGSAVNPAPPRSVDGLVATTERGVGAHQTHVGGGALGKTFDCSECHTKPAAYDDPGHILLSEGVLDELPAELTFGGLAGAQASWDRDAARCSGVYCHGDSFGDSAAANTTPTWTTVDGSEAACGSCHGLPPADHASDQCERCHTRVVNAAKEIIDPALHVDGAIDFGDGSGTCSACHGGSDGPAPPKDLSGSSNNADIGVGAHASHLTSQRLRGPVPCGACHLVPAEVASPGHLDTDLPAEVFPSDPGFESLATADGATPSWDRTTTTCTGVYCHGNGDKLASDATSGLNRTPDWTMSGTGQAACGACHGLPPANGLHNQTWTVTFCFNCHADKVDSSGVIIITDGVSTHINGVADVQ